MTFIPQPPPGRQQTKDLLEADVLYMLLNKELLDGGVGWVLMENGWHLGVITNRLDRMCRKGMLTYGTGLFTPWIDYKLSDEINIARGKVLTTNCYISIEKALEIMRQWQPIRIPTHFH